MNKLFKNLNIIAISAILSTAAVTNVTTADELTSTKLLTANFESRDVVQVEAGDFHFVPGQVAPIHTHTAPAIGYVVKGEIIYQVEGEKQIILKEGDAFYEPAGPRILRFDNASATEKAIFVDFNLEQEGEPFIVFEKAPTEAIDRRTLPTTKLSGKALSQASIFSTDIEAGASIDFTVKEPTFALVAHGIVVIKRKDGKSQRVVEGATFSLTTVNDSVKLTNGSTEIPAQVITFSVK